MGGRTRQVDAGGHSPDGGNQLIDFVPHQQSAVSGFGTLPIFDLDGTGILFHVRDGMNNLIPAKIAAGDLQDDVF